MRMQSTSVSLVGWGHPSHPKTFSGYSRTLANALRSENALRYEYDARSIRAVDLIAGAGKVVYRGGRIRFEVSRRWMWRTASEAKLSQRLQNQIRRTRDRGPFLQIGTLVTIPPELGIQCVLTDMTVVQAHAAGQFSISALDSGSLAEAIALQKQVFANAAHIFVLSNWTKESVVCDFGVPEGKVTTIYAGPNLVPQDGFRRLESKAPIKRRVLFVGIDWERKGGPLLLDAFRKCREQFPDAKLTLVGCSPQVDDVGVEVVGYLDRRDPEQLARLMRCYEESDCFCLPSLFDPFPNAILEAAAFGMATVAIDNGSRREVIENGVTGQLASSPTASDLAAALITVISDSNRCIKMGVAARQRQLDHFSWNKVVGVILDRVSDLCEERE